MKKFIAIATAILLSAALILSLGACGDDSDEEESTVESSAAVYTPDIPVSTADIISYYNGIIAFVCDDSNFDSTAPAVEPDRSFSVSSIVVTESGETETSSRLESLQNASTQIKNLILTDLPTSDMIPDTIEYGAGSIADTIGNAADYELTMDDVVSAEFYQYGEIYYISIYIESEDDTVANVFNAVDTDAIYEEFTTAEEYAVLNSFTATYIDQDDRTIYNADNPDNITCCLIYLEVEAETGYVQYLAYTRAVYIEADVTGTGAFEDYGDFEVHFRFTDVLSFTFDWDEPTDE